MRRRVLIPMHWLLRRFFGALPPKQRRGRLIACRVLKNRSCRRPIGRKRRACAEVSAHWTFCDLLLSHSWPRQSTGFRARGDQDNRRVGERCAARLSRWSRSAHLQRPINFTVTKEK